MRDQVKNMLRESTMPSLYKHELVIDLECIDNLLPYTLFSNIIANRRNSASIDSGNAAHSAGE